MSEPKRYKVEQLNCCFDADMIESPTGEYVEYSDYARLKAEVERLTEELKKTDCMFAMASAFARDWNAAKEGKQP